jgi:hypothetical protein
VAQQSQQSQQSRLSPQERLIASLLDKIAEDRYPSFNMMEFVERNITPQQRDAYLHVLLDKIEDDRFPSIDLIRRVERLTG